MTTSSTLTVPPALHQQDFASALSDLEKIVRNLERTDLPLEQLLDSFEKGTRLVQECQRQLAQAEQRIQVLEQPDTETPTAADSQGHGAV